MKHLKKFEAKETSSLYKETLLNFMEDKFLIQGALADSYFFGELNTDTGNDEKDMLEFGLGYINEEVMTELMQIIKFFTDNNIMDVKEWSINISKREGTGHMGKTSKFIEFALPLPKNLPLIQKLINIGKFDL